MPIESATGYDGGMIRFMRNSGAAGWTIDAGRAENFEWIESRP